MFTKSREKDEEIPEKQNKYGKEENYVWKIFYR
jgi:hypothetical protein